MPICPSCQQDSAADSPVCQHCGAALRSRRQRALPIAAAAILVAVIAAALVAYLLLARRPSGPAGSIPSRAPVYLELDLRPGGAGQPRPVARLWRQAKQAGVFDRLNKLANQSLLKEGVDLEEDLFSWAGGQAGLAVFDLQKSAPRSWLAAIAIARPQRARESLERTRPPWKQVRTEDYRGVRILVKQRGRDFQGEAICGSYYLVSDQLPLLKEGIELSQGRKGSIAEVAAYQKSLKTLPPDRLLTLFVNRTAWTGQLRRSPLGVQPEGVDAVALGLRADDRGLAVDAVLVGPKVTVKSASPALTASEAVFSGLPKQAVVGVAAPSLATIWAEVEKGLKGDPKSRQSLDAIRLWPSVIGLDLEEDLLGWMTGPIGIGLWPAKDAKSADYVFSIGSRSPAAMTQKVEQARKALESRSKIHFARTRLLGAQAYLFTPPRGNPTGYSVNGDRLLIGTPAGLKGSLSALSGKGSLTDRPGFKQAMTRLPKGMMAAAYLDLPALAEGARAGLRPEKARGKRQPEIAWNPAILWKFVGGSALGFRVDQQATRLTLWTAIDYQGLFREIGKQAADK